MLANFLNFFHCPWSQSINNTVKSTYFINNTLELYPESLIHILAILQITSISATNHISHKPYRPQQYRPHWRPNRPQAKSISATCRYRSHDIGHKRL